MNYTSNQDQIIFLKDRDIIQNLSAQNIDATEVTVNGIASYTLVQKLYHDTTTSVDNLCVEISDLNTYVDNISAKLFNDIIYLSDEVSSNNNDITDLYLSVNELCGQILSNDDDIAKISTDIQIHLDKGVLYKGDLIIIDNTKTYSTLSDYFHDNLIGDHEYTFKLGDMYRFSVPVKIENGLMFGKNDYIIINKNVNLKDITSSDINIIKDDTIEINELCDNYIEFNHFVTISAENLCSEINVNREDIDILYLSSDSLQEQIFNNDDDILSITLSVDNLCSEIDILEESLSTTVDENYVHVSGDIIDGKIEIQNELIVTQTISADSTIYSTSNIQVGNYDELEPIAYSGNKLEIDVSSIYVTEKLAGKSAITSIYEFPGKSGVFSLVSDLNETSSSLCSTISNDIEFLSNEISTNNTNTILSANNLCAEISATNIHLNTVDENLDILSGQYNNTFCNNDITTTDNHINSNNLIITDPNDSDPTGGHKHDKYYLSFEKGTLVLIPLK